MCIRDRVNDPRSSDKKTFGNPYQYVFQQMMDETIADENVYEIPETRGKQGDVELCAEGGIFNIVNGSGKASSFFIYSHAPSSGSKM